MFSLNFYIPVSVIWCTERGFGCGVTMCAIHRQTLHCNHGKILLTNVTDTTSGEPDDWAFSNLRRMCMGKSTCDPNRNGRANFCRDRTPLKVSYLCVFETNQRCSGTAEEIATTNGFIQNPQYPDTVLQRCKWTLSVPVDSYVTIIIHDLELTGSNSPCNAGIQLESQQKCVNHTLTSDIICKKDSVGPLMACGSVNINLVPDGSGSSKVRFWISYSVTKYSEVPDPYYLGNLSEPCPEGTYDAMESIMISAPLGTPPEAALVQPSPSSSYVDIPSSNITILEEKKEITSTDSTERAVFYIAVAVAAISLTGLVIVTVVCIRRQKRLKATGVISGSPMRVNSHTANRPLPPISKHRPTEQNGHVQFADRPQLQDSYSRVVDEVPFNGSHDSTRSPAYAEVDDNISPMPGRHVFRYGPRGDGRKQSTENVYSDLNDGKPEFIDGKIDKNIYHEITVHGDGNTSSPGPSSNDYTKLLSEKDAKYRHKPHSISPKSSKGHRPTSFEGPYSYCELPEPRKTLSKDLSDSDGSLVLMDNEVYDHYQSAHV